MPQIRRHANDTNGFMKTSCLFSIFLFDADANIKTDRLCPGIHDFDDVIT